MDLRMMSCVTGEMEEGIDTGNAEFAKEQLENKYYKDLLKCVLASKIQLNHILRDRCANEISSVEMPLAIFSGITMDVYALSLKSSGLYVLQDVAQTKFPMTFMDLKHNGIENMIKALATYKKMAMKIHDINEENEQGGTKRKKVKVIPRNQGRPYALSVVRQDASTWTRALWKPPRMESDSDSEGDE
ncbi:hypothetical protein V8B55DRAFT_1096820 [Mucor lusitanicus]|uniref:Uncharacterized protein n=2 Tax=Mucor circinelloides f. lusitanicus TaxID=29924 RepID=A0A168PYK5_MUCCL|nr:hypothetical protein FB192DRAFT_1083164 [Mucor lusitanicus]OAD08424.1 hypothetical protein MUCCIDRAFT_76670 [Mucor lusitanicus CBS 277.49]